MHDLCFAYKACSVCGVNEHVTWIGADTNKEVVINAAGY